MDDIRMIVADEIHRIAALRGTPLAEIYPHQGLTDDLGIKSLDLAHLVAALEMRLGVDPFLRDIPITSVRTVGDLCAAYRQCLAPEWELSDKPAAAGGSVFEHQPVRRRLPEAERVIRQQLRNHTGN